MSDCPRVCFTQSRAGVLSALGRFSAGASTLCVYSAKKAIYDMSGLEVPGVRMVDFGQYGQHGDVFHEEPGRSERQASGYDRLVVVGLSEMITPANRCDIRFEYMYNISRFPGGRFVIDGVPYKEEPWRIVFPFMLVDPAILRFPHSYAAQSAFANHEMGLTGFSFAPEEILPLIQPHAFSDEASLFPPIQFRVSPVSEAVAAEYTALKERLFDTETTLTPILRGLWSYARQHAMGHNLPIDTRFLYRVPVSSILYHTDLAVDRFLAGRVARVVEHSNAILSALHRKKEGDHAR